MKKNFFVIGLTLVPFLCLAQVGIGTMTPNVKSILDLSSINQGFLVPRMTYQQKIDLLLTSPDAGMMVYQTNQPAAPNNYPKGLYYFDGTSWVAPINNGTSNGQTLRWDSKAWVATSNLFNNGSSIGIGTQSPNTQLQVHSNSAPTARLQLSCGTGLNTEPHGLMLGINNNLPVNSSSSHGFLIQQENKPLWFGTAAVERMRIDSAGNVGIGTTNPSAKLTVNGTVKLGTYGTLINDIIKADMEVVVPQLAAGGEATVAISCPNANEGATVYVSPSIALLGLMIGYSRVSAPDTVEVKFMNMGSGMPSPLPLTLHTIIFQ